jgi:hypothetical protein
MFPIRLQEALFLCASHTIRLVPKENIPAAQSVALDTQAMPLMAIPILLTNICHAASRSAIVFLSSRRARAPRCFRKMPYYRANSSRQHEEKGL